MGGGSKRTGGFPYTQTSVKDKTITDCLDKRDMILERVGKAE